MATQVESKSAHTSPSLVSYSHCFQRNGGVTSSGQPAVNMDLFLKLEEEIIELEQRGSGPGLEIGFWHIPRRYNAVADSLANKAADLASPRRF